MKGRDESGMSSEEGELNEFNLDENKTGPVRGCVNKSQSTASPYLTPSSGTNDEQQRSRLWSTACGEPRLTVVSRETHRVVNSPPLSARLQEPVSMWNPMDKFEEQLADYRKLRERFVMTNRYLLFEGFNNSFFKKSKKEIHGILDLLTGAHPDHEIEVVTTNSLTGQRGLHVAFKARQNARAATTRLNQWHKSAKAYMSGIKEFIVSSCCDAYDNRVKHTSLPPIQEVFEIAVSIRYEWVAPREASTTLWIGNLRELKGNGTPGSDNDINRDFLRVLRYFGRIRHYRAMNQLGCWFVAFSKVSEAIRVRNALFGWCLGGKADACINIDFSAFEEFSTGVAVDYPLLHPCSPRQRLSALLSGDMPLGIIPEGDDEIMAPYRGGGEGPPGRILSREVIKTESSSVDEAIKTLTDDARFLNLIMGTPLAGGGFFIPIIENAAPPIGRIASGRIASKVMQRDTDSEDECFSVVKREDEVVQSSHLQEEVKVHEAFVKSEVEAKVEGTVRGASRGSSDVGTPPEVNSILQVLKQGKVMMTTTARLVGGSEKVLRHDSVNLSSRVTVRRLRGDLTAVTNGESSLKRRQEATWGLFELLREAADDQSGFTELVAYLLQRDRIGMSMRDGTSYFVIPPRESFISAIKADPTTASEKAENAKILYLVAIAPG